jgi:hypothetical protein
MELGGGEGRAPLVQKEEIRRGDGDIEEMEREREKNSEKSTRVTKHLCQREEH